MTATIAAAMESDTVERAGRFGLASRGVIYCLVAALAAQMAFGRNDQPAEKEGALRSLAGNGFGRIALVVLALGFSAYALWRFAEAFGRRDGWGKRVLSGGKALLYLSAAATAASTILDVGSGGGASNEQSRTLTARVLGWPAGQVLVGLAGLVAIGVGAWLLWRGATRKFEKKLKLAEMPSTVERVVKVVGVVGHSARGLVAALLGLLLIRAAIEHDPSRAQGIDGTLRTIAEQPYGRALLLVTALGLAAYGVHSFAEARYRRT